MWNNNFDKTGYNSEMCLYKSRYYAKKAACGDEVVVKVDGGFRIMKTADYLNWRKQR